MAEKFLIVIDMQNDFITGALSSPEASAILGNVVKKVEGFDGRILFTKDTHDEKYGKTQEGRLLPVSHCIKGSEGWKLAKPLDELSGKKGAMVFEKNSFGSISLAKYLSDVNQAEPISSITLIGVCTDICVVSNALLLKAYLPEVEIHVDPSCVAGVSRQKNEAALETMRSCQIILDSSI